MKRKFFLYGVMAFIAVFMAGNVSAIEKSRTAKYKNDGKVYSIYATGDGKFNIDITIFVNDQAIIKESMNAFSGPANFSGDYEKIKVDAECKNVDTGSNVLSRQCVVYMDGNKAAELSF